MEMHSVQNHEKTNKNLAAVGFESKASDFHALHATFWANSLLASYSHILLIQKI